MNEQTTSTSQDETFTLTESSSPCYSNRHMDSAEDSVYHLLSRLSVKSHTVSYSAESLAGLYRPESESADHIASTLENLIKEGWVVRNPRPFKTARGVYRVIKHDEWVTTHPGRCHVQDTGASADSGNDPVGLTAVNGNDPVGLTAVNGNEGGLTAVNGNVTAVNGNYGAGNGSKETINQPLNEKAAAADLPLLAVTDRNDTSLQTGVTAVGGKSETYTVPPALVEMVQKRVLVPQRLDDIDHRALARIEKLPMANVQAVFDWATNDGWWMQRLVGSSTLRNFIRWYTSIVPQMVGKQRQKAQTAGPMKAASVASSGTISNMREIV